MENAFITGCCQALGKGAPKLLFPLPLTLRVVLAPITLQWQSKNKASEKARKQERAEGTERGKFPLLLFLLQSTALPVQPSAVAGISKL